MNANRSPIESELEIISPDLARWRYSAFISYRHSDNQLQDREWASWLHEQLETFEIPHDLRATKNLRGETIPETLYPVFRDEESLPADANLASGIEIALRQSSVLVVLCSPRAVESKYVAQEIERFRQLGRGQRIVAAIIDGEPNASRDKVKQSAGHQECFPAPLIEYCLGSETDPTVLEPLAADFRFNGKEGYIRPQRLREILAENGVDTGIARHAVKKYTNQLELAKLKIIAGILGIPLEELTKRDLKRRLQRGRRNTRISLAVAVTLLTAAGISLWQWREAANQRNISEGRRVSGEHQTALAEQQRRLAELRAAETKVLLDGASAQSRLATDPSEAGDEMLRVVRTAEKTFGKIPLTLQSAVAETWVRDREIRRIQLPGRYPAISFRPNSQFIIVEIPSERVPGIPDGTKPSTYWQFDVKLGTLKQMDAPPSEKSKLHIAEPSHVSNWVPESQKKDFEARIGDLHVQWSKIVSETLTVSQPERSIDINIAPVGGINCWLPFRGQRNLIVTGGGLVGDVEAFGPIECSIQFWSSEGKLLATLAGHGHAIWDLAANEHAGLLASVDEEGELIVWDVANVVTPLQIGTPQTAIGAGKYALAVRDDGRFLVDTGYFGWKIYDLHNWRNLSTEPSEEYSRFNEGQEPGYTPPVNSGLVSLPRDAGFAAIIENRVEVLGWDAKVHASSSSHPMKISSLVASEDGTFLAWIVDGRVWIWRHPFKNGGPICIDAPDPIKAIAVRKDCRLLVVTTHNGVQIIDPTAPSTPFKLGFIGTENCTVFLGDRGEILATLKEVGTGGGSSNQASIMFWKEDGTHLVSGSSIKLQMGVSGANVFTTAGLVAIGLADGSVQLWDADQGTLFQNLPKVHHAAPYCFAMSSDDDTLYSTGRDGMIVIYKQISFSSQLRDLVERKAVKSVKVTDSEGTPEMSQPFLNFWRRHLSEVHAPDSSSNNRSSNPRSALVELAAENQSVMKLPAIESRDEKIEDTRIKMVKPDSPSLPLLVSKPAELFTDEPKKSGVSKTLLDGPETESKRVKFASYWNHNGSVMGLVADGDKRSMVYVNVRDQLTNLVKPGTWLFKGSSDGNNYRGTARRFSAGMPPLEYAVSGPIIEGGNRVVLTGKVTIRRSNGKTETFTDRLDFRLQRLEK